MKTPSPGRPAPAAGHFLLGFADAVSVVVGGIAGGSAAVVAAIGQFALGAVLALVAFGIFLRLARRKRTRGRVRPSS